MLIGQFLMAAGDLISARGKVLKHTYISTKIKRKLVKFDVHYEWKEKFYIALKALDLSSVTLSMIALLI